jgi:hypothetical protein
VFQIVGQGGACVCGIAAVIGRHAAKPDLNVEADSLHAGQ